MTSSEPIPPRRRLTLPRLQRRRALLTGTTVAITNGDPRQRLSKPMRRRTVHRPAPPPLPPLTHPATPTRPDHHRTPVLTATRDIHYASISTLGDIGQVFDSEGGGEARMSELLSVIDALAVLDVHGLPAPALLMAVEELITARDRLDAVIARGLQALDVGDVTVIECGRQTRSWLVEEQHL